MNRREELNYYIERTRHVIAEGENIRKTISIKKRQEIDKCLDILKKICLY